MLKALEAEIQQSSNNNLQLSLKKERIANFLLVPLEFEKFVIFGYVICLDEFLSLLTILPIRAFKRYKSDLFRILLIISCCWLLGFLDASRLYHSIR